MEKSFKYRIYPNKEQEILINKTFGCSRFIYNYFLDKKIKLYETEKKSTSYFDDNKELTKIKVEYEWLKDVPSNTLITSLKDLNIAYKNFFKQHNGFPKFKSKKSSIQSYRDNCGYSSTKPSIEFLDTHIKLPKLKMVKIRGGDLKPQGRILNATISRESTGKYYCSLCCTEVEIDELSKTNKEIGIDLGIKDFAITSDGDKYDNPKYLKKYSDKLAKLQRQLARKKLGGKNREKAKIKVVRCYEKIRNCRKDFQQKLSTKLIRENDIICA